MLLSSVYYTFRAFQIARETTLKRDMVARGYSAQEIIEVVAPSRVRRRMPITDAPPAKPVKPSHFEGIPVQKPL